MTGDLDMGDNFIQNLGYPKDILGAVNKGHLDSEIAGCLPTNGKNPLGKIRIGVGMGFAT